MLFGSRVETLLLDSFQHRVDRDAVSVEFHEQSIHIFCRFRFLFPFVFDRLNTVKPCQGLFDLVRSVASQDLQVSIHTDDMQGDLIQPDSWMACRRRTAGGRFGKRAACH
jgi:hypothetical protein